MLNVIVLAAGNSTRMQSEKSKVLHKLLDRPVINYVGQLVSDIGADNSVFVVQKDHDEIKQALNNDKFVFEVQQGLRGTGSAVYSAKSLQDKGGETLILMGDTPLIKPETLKNLIKANKNFDFTLLSMVLPDGEKYGRIVRDNEGKFTKVIEYADATPQVKAIKEVNTGIYCVKNEALFKFLPYIQNDKNNSGESYFIDIVELLVKNNKKAQAIVIDDKEQFFGTNTREELLRARKILTKRINQTHMQNGVSFVNPENTYIGVDVEIEKDCVIYDNVHIYGKTKIKSGSVIKQGSWIENSIIGKDCKISNSVVTNSEIKSSVTIGPFANIRNNSVISEGSIIGAFVEVKNSFIGKNTKSLHHSYIGDAVVGSNVNVGCGVVFANYNGTDKNQTIVKDNAFIGSNSSLIAPVVIGEGAYIAGGSTINLDVEDGAMAIARAVQVNKPDYAKRYMQNNNSKK